MLSIYVLRLARDKYYVGKSTKPYLRIKDHFNKKGSAWTKKYPPIETLRVYNNCCNFDEDKYTKKYMEKYGIENVRGGTFSSVKLDDMEVEFIKKSLITASDRCYQCGQEGHFANECPMNYDPNFKVKNEITCSRCGRKGHKDKNCYAYKDINGKKLKTY